MNKYRVSEIVKKYIHYDMIQAHTELPQFPELRARLLYTMLRKNEQPVDESELFTLVTSLAQFALDTHDRVAEAEPVEDLQHMRSRQLRVLAGDYFSGRFYHLLAQAGQIDLTRQLSFAICEANRMKMNLYQTMKQFKLSADEYIHELARSRIQLFLIFSSRLEEKHRSAWPDLLLRLTTCEIIAEELEKCETVQLDRDSWTYWHLLEKGSQDEMQHIQSGLTDPGSIRTLTSKYQVKRHLFQRLETQVKSLEDLFRRIDPERTISGLAGLLEPFMRFLAAPQVIEEM
jgi:heptaprenyl diphosphate synthase